MKKEKLITAPGKKVSVEKNYKKLVKSGAVTLKKGIKTPVKKKKIDKKPVKDRIVLKKNGLTPKQELFCIYYTSDKESFANGTQSYIEAYDIDVHKKGAYRSAQVNASKMLSNAIILKRVNELLDLGGLNEEFVDKQLNFVITQNSDLPSKVAGIREFNKLRGRITEKIDHTTKGKELPTPILGGASNVSTNNSD